MARAEWHLRSGLVSDTFSRLVAASSSSASVDTRCLLEAGGISSLRDVYLLSISDPAGLSKSIINIIYRY